MFYGSCRKVSKLLSISIEPISKSTVHDLAKKFSKEVKITRESKIRKCIAIDETKLKIKDKIVYIWSAIDINSKELLALEASYGRISLNALIFLKKVLKLCINKPKVIIDKGPWYIWPLNKIGLEYEHKTFGIRNCVERFFRYLKERTIVFHNKLSAKDYIKRIKNLNLFLNLFTLYYQAIRSVGG